MRATFGSRSGYAWPLLIATSAFCLSGQLNSKETKFTSDRTTDDITRRRCGLGRHVENARKVAEFLRYDSRVEWVKYAGFESSPWFQLTQKYLSGRASSLFTFGIRGGVAAGSGWGP